jgi:hypothetical protein
MEPTAQYWIAVDLGQAVDFTAAAVFERAELPGGWDPVMLAHSKATRISLRHLERLPLGTPYPEVIERLRLVTEQQELAGRCRLVVDATGVGRPVVDALRRAKLNCGILPVMITSAHMQREEGGYHFVPKRDLILELQLMVQKKELQIASGMRGMNELLKEMMEMQVKISLAGNEQFGAWREGQHDDLVLAVALGCWAVKKEYPEDAEGEDRYWRRKVEEPDLWEALGGAGRI